MPRKNRNARPVARGVAVGARHKSPVPVATKFEPHRLPLREAVARINRIASL